MIVLPIFMMAGATAEEILLAGWDGAGDTSSGISRAADTARKTIDATVVWGEGSSWIGAGAGSDDLTFGSFSGEKARLSLNNKTGALLSKGNPATLDFVVRNNGDETYRIVSFRFDAWRSWNGQAEDYAVSFTTADGADSVLLSKGAFNVQGAAPQAGTPDYQDIDILMEDIKPCVLPPGGSIVFHLSVSDSRENAHDVYIDNVAITGNQE